MADTAAQRRKKAARPMPQAIANALRTFEERVASLAWYEADDLHLSQPDPIAHRGAKQARDDAYANLCRAIKQHLADT